MAHTDLAELARSNDLPALEQAWSDAAARPGDLSDLRQTIEALCDQELPAKALAMATEMADALEAQGRASDARVLLAVLVQRGAHNDKVAQRLLQYIETQDGEQPWFQQIRDLARLNTNNLTAESLANYERFRRFTKGHVLFHQAGWGEGLVTEFRIETSEVVIDFVHGRVREMPLQAAVESLRPLADDDLRAMRILEPDKLEALAQEQPSQLIRMAARIFRGKITSTKLKEVLSPAVIPTKKWGGFWKRAKAGAAHDPWLHVEGSATRPVFVLRKKPLGLADEARQEIRFADDLPAAMATCRNYLGRSHDQNAVNTILDLCKDIVDDALEKARNGDASHSPADLLDGILLLAEHGRETIITPAEELRVLLMQDGEFHPERIEMLSTNESKLHAVALLADALGENWAELCIEKLPLFPSTVVEVLVEKIVAAGKAPSMLKLWDAVAPYPRRHPMMTYMMGCLFADDVFKDVDGAPDDAAVGRVLMHLVRTLTEDRKGDPSKGRLLTRLVSLLTGRRGFLERILEDISKEDCAAYHGIAERTGHDFPQEISNMLLRTIVKRFPEIIAKQDRPFWESEYNYVTRAGLERHTEDYRVLVEEKIPANSTAIGAAASHGDLSENSEWDAAMEEQRNLTARAETMGEELRLARLIEDQVIPPETVAPGTRVTYTNLTENQECSIAILGPWDVTSEEILNYKAPLGQALLGMKPGQVMTLTLGGIPYDFRVDQVDRL